MDTPTPPSEDAASPREEGHHYLRDVSPAVIELAIGESITRLTGIEHKVELATIGFRTGSLGTMSTDVTLVITAETFGSESGSDRRVVVFLPAFERRDSPRPPDEAPAEAPPDVAPEAPTEPALDVPPEGA